MNTMLRFCLLYWGGTAWVLLAAADPDQAYNAARQSLRDGRDDQALTQFRQFANQYPDHPQAPDAALAAAVLTLTRTNDPVTARAAAQGVCQQWPNTDAADAAAWLVDLLDKHRGRNAQALALLVAGKTAEQRGDPAGAAARYEELAELHPQSPLADKALFAAGQLQLSKARAPDAAYRDFNRHVELYPDSPRVAQARYQRAAACEQWKGTGEETLAAYRDVVANHPKSDVGRKAQERLNRLAPPPAPTLAPARVTPPTEEPPPPAKPPKKDKPPTGTPVPVPRLPLLTPPDDEPPPTAKPPKKGREPARPAAPPDTAPEKPLFERQFPADLAMPFTPARTGYAADDPQLYEVIIRLPKKPAPKVLQATLETALLRYAKQRKSPDHAMHVSALAGRDTVVGEARWQPPEAPKYTLGDAE